MQKLKHNAHLIVLIAILFVSGLSFAKVFNVRGSFLVYPVSADDEEDREESEDDREDSDDNDRDEEEDDRDNEDENDKDDEDKDDDEDEQRTTHTRATTQVRIQEANDDEDENEADEDENEDVEDLKEDIGELNKDIRKVELKISVLAADGVAIGSFNSGLAEVKNLIAQVNALFVSNPKGAEDTLEIAEHKLERLEKLVKMSLKDDDEDEESTEEAIEEIQELERDINKLDSQLNTASTNGMDVAAYRTILSNAKEMLSQAKEKLSAGLYIEAEALADLGDKKLDKIDDIIEDLFEKDDDEDDTAEEYKNEVALFVHNLKNLGEIEGGIGQRVRVVAQAQNDSEDDVEGAIKDIDDRSDFVEFLIGPKYKSIAEINTVIVENQTRIKVLTELVNQLTDPAVKLVLQDQIAVLNQQNANLQNFVRKSESRISLFGWLMKLLS